MYAQISYEYSKLDNQHEILISCAENWVWFHLGAMLKKEGIKQSPGFLMIYPYLGNAKVIKTIEKDDCEEIAEGIVKFIKKKLKL